MDTTDIKILRELQENGRLSNVELARRINLSPTPCLERVRRLEKSGIIRKYVALIDPRELGSAMLVFVQITLDRMTTDVFEQFRDAAVKLPEVLECHMISGGFDYMLKARVRDMLAYKVFLGESLVTLPGVRETHSYVVIEEVKSTTAIPIREDVLTEN